MSKNAKQLQHACVCVCVCVCVEMAQRVGISGEAP